MAELRVLSTRELAPNEIKRVFVDDHEPIAVYNLAGEYFATDDCMAAPWHPAIAAFVHPCTSDAGGTTPWMGEVERSREPEPRATQEAKADDTCTHGQASLSEGTIEGDEIFCPFHMGAFSIKTGEATAPPCVSPLRTYPVRVEGDGVYLELED
jgi:nitrite reductase/ring-hydroxylating ferredoxin subunit